MGIESFVSDQLNKRETRGRSPEFRVAIDRENTEFGTVLSELGHNALDAGVTTILKTPTTLCLNGLKAIYSKNYNISDWATDALKLFFGKDGVAHSTVKVAANALHLAGQGAKIGIRQLFKV